jgi:hypothetical protein
MPERRSGEDRRAGRRLRLSLEVAVPAMVRGPDGVTRGLVRNLSEGGLLLQLEELPPIGAVLEITLMGIHGSSDAPDSVTLKGEVRHHVGWQYKSEGKRRTLRGVGVRFLEEADPETTWGVWANDAGQTLH